jgi:hypothetical protein
MLFNEDAQRKAEKIRISNLTQQAVYPSTQDCSQCWLSSKNVILPNSYVLIFKI